MTSSEVKINSEEFLYSFARDYSMETATERAIPLIWDGLKDSQRIAAYMMQNKTGKIKTVSLAGEMIAANLYLHGDASASGAAQAMAAPYTNNIPLFEGIGNFGTKVCPDEYASPRYSYIKKSKFADDILYIDKDIIPMKENYDGSTKSPANYIPLIPMVLLNGVLGLAVGWSTEILPHKFSDIVEGCIDILDGKKCRKIKPFYNYLTVTESTEPEPEKFEFNSIIEKIGTNSWLIKELAPGIKLENVIKTLDDLEDNGTISSYEDNTKDEISITVNFKRGSEWTKEQILSKLKLISRITERIVVVDFDNKSIKQYDNPESVIETYVKERTKLFYTRYSKKIANAISELAFYRLVKQCFDDKVQEKLKDIKSKEDLKNLINISRNNVSSKEEFYQLASENDVDRVINFPTYKWIDENYQDSLKKINELIKNIKDYNLMISDEKNIKKQYKSELKDLLKKYD